MEPDNQDDFNLEVFLGSPDAIALNIYNLFISDIEFDNWDLIKISSTSDEIEGYEEYELVLKNRKTSEEKIHSYTITFQDLDNWGEISDTFYERIRLELIETIFEQLKIE